jgi:hypothetical protein
MFKEAVWAIAQHYELWPTPLIDITQNLRTAASFALWDGQSIGNYMFSHFHPAQTPSLLTQISTWFWLACRLFTRRWQNDRIIRMAFSWGGSRILE